MDCFLISSVSPRSNLMTVMMWLSCLWWISCICLCDTFILYMTPCPMVMWLFQPYIKIFKCCFISGPIKSVLRDPSLEENTSFFLKWFCCYLGVYLLQPGYILSANSWNLYLSLHPFVPWSTVVFFPSFPFASELAIVRWRIEVVEAQVGDSVSPVRRRHGDFT